LSPVYLQLYLAGIEVRNLLAGRTYDSRVIDSPDKATRQVIATELLAALFSQDFEEQERARQLFLDHGYFDEATRKLKSAESPADRAAAARKLGIVGSQLATAHLIAALFDDVPEVRRAGAEALIQIGDPGVGTAALNAILIGEMARDVAEVSAATGRVVENIKLDETASAKYAGEKVWFRARQPSVADLSGASDEAHLLMEEDARKADSGGGDTRELHTFEMNLTGGTGDDFMWVFIAVNVLAAGALVIASALALQFLVLPYWLGGLVGLLLYLLTLFLNRLADDDEEAQLVMLDCWADVQRIDE